MKKIFMGIIILVSLLLAPNMVLAGGDRVIIIEFGIGIGGSGSVTQYDPKSKNLNWKNLRWCKNRNWKGLTFSSIRYRQGIFELHYARWWHVNSDVNCNRTSNAVGGAIVIRSGDGRYIVWTPGIAYTWGPNRDFTNQKSGNTNWRLNQNWQILNRFSVVADNIVISYNYYGSYGDGEHFLSFGLVNYVPIVYIATVGNEKEKDKTYGCGGLGNGNASCQGNEKANN